MAFKEPAFKSKEEAEAFFAALAHANDVTAPPRKKAPSKPAGTKKAAPKKSGK